MSHPKPRRVHDVEALKALTHPLRLALLGHLLVNGPRTASECAVAVRSSASNCSWHLRQLARFDFVERAESGDGRERPWRATAVGFDIGAFDEDPAVRTAQEALLALGIAEDNRQVRAFLDRQDEFSREWLVASAHHVYGLRVSPEELTGLMERVDDLLRPYLAPLRRDAPEDAAVVRVGVQAFPLVEG